MRPQRLYKTDDGRYYFIIEGKRKYIRIPKNITEADLVKLNTKTIIKLFGKRVKPRKKRKPIPKLEKPIINGPLGAQLAISGVSNQPTASSKFVQQEKPITQIEELITQDKTRAESIRKFDKLVEQAGKSANELFSNALIVQGAKTLTKPTIADTTTDKVEISKGKTEKEADKNPPPKSEKIGGTDMETINELIEAAMIDTTQMKAFFDLEENQTLKPGTTKAYKAYLQRVINTYFKPGEKKSTLDLSEDQMKEIFKKYSKDNSFREQFQETLDELKVEAEGKEPYDSFNVPPSSNEARSTEASETTSSDDKPIKKNTKPPPLESVPQKTLPPITTKKELDERKRKGATGLMPSLKNKPLTTEQKLASTPSFSGTSPLPSNSVYQQAKADYYASLTPEERAKQEAKDQMGFGNDGLYNDQIAKIIRKRVGRIIPVIPSDRVHELLAYVKKGDKKFGAVINTNPSTSDGSGNDGYRPGHWRAIFIDNEDDFPSVEYFDPLAEGAPEKSLADIMKKLCKKINPEHLCLYKQNNLRRQAKEKSTCGWHVLQFLDDRYNRVPWSEATGYDHYMENLPISVDDSIDGEKEVMKYIKKYKVYL